MVLALSTLVGSFEEKCRDKHCDVTGKRQLLEYEIQDWKLFIDNTGEMSQAEVKIVFRRLAHSKLQM